MCTLEMIHIILNNHTLHSFDNFSFYFDSPDYSKIGIRLTTMSCTKNFTIALKIDFTDKKLLNVIKIFHRSPQGRYMLFAHLNYSEKAVIIRYL